ncbi:UPF0481 protein At3g47200-like [Aegilops tauschii subsp. strangulata]|uniref:UPF0481 protein At3g47200-like n=1 Tax=Aegilops tauschii subsp. strangulata TaxID=200361 RepID=UPI00098B5E10|nr:UPF0481 protein At3g47200-like [Aegilops tauschii subsp. strangulata]
MYNMLDPILPGQLYIDIQEMVRDTRERPEADFSKLDTKIQRFPQGLRPGVEERYIIPSFVSLGPYHHGSPHLRETEELKHAAAHYFCEMSGHSVAHVYDKILHIAGEGRSCYVHDAVAKFTDAEFAVMMFLDGCYLLLYMAGTKGCAFLCNRMTLSTGPCMLRDIFLLENQLPWLVLEALMDFLTPCPVYKFVHKMGKYFYITRRPSSLHSNTRVHVDELKKYKPPHLLGLLRYSQLGNMTNIDLVNNCTCQSSSSGIELAEIGIKLTASSKTGLADMSVQRGYLFGQLSLTPLFVNDVTACWLISMAAYEACVSTTYPSDGFVISSYISFMAMLMDKEEDVHELRAKHIVGSFFSNTQRLVFFKGLATHLRLGRLYFIITDKIDKFKRERPVSIAVHRFVYKNSKAIVTVLSIGSQVSSEP